MEALDFVRSHYADLRSITGEGNRRLLRAVQAHFLPEMHLHEVPSGTPCRDWTVPPEWNCRSARLWDPAGNLVVDMTQHNLHVLNYSIPFAGELNWSELEPHLHSLPDKPGLIPYKTSYYRRDWGLCLPHAVKEALPRTGTYRVEIDVTLDDQGSLSYGEWFLPGHTADEVLLSAHICHPQLAIDNLSSVAVLAALGRQLAQAGPQRLGVRILLVPGTIGPVVWLSRNPKYLAQPPAYAFVVALAGAPGPLHLKQPPGQGHQHSWALARHTAETTQRPFNTLPYEPYGYDERQYNTLGPAMQAVRIGRANYGGYPAYHTSADDLSLLSAEGIADTLAYLQDLLAACQAQPRYTSQVRHGEPQYSKHGAFEAIGHVWPDRHAREQALYWLMSHADATPLPALAQQSGLPLHLLELVAEALVAIGLLQKK